MEVEGTSRAAADLDEIVEDDLMAQPKPRAAGRLSLKDILGFTFC